MTIPDTLLDRFFNALVKEIRGSRPAYLQSPFTVAEIYQNLVPYRTHRDVIGAEINGDYEDALLRLLAGEGEFLQLESEPARKRIQDELRGSNPNTTIYREFAAAEVRVHPGRARLLASGVVEGASGEGGVEDSGWLGDPAGPSLGGGRVEVGWAPEEATPVADVGSPDPGVDPELGLFVSDLFGGGGGDPPEEEAKEAVVESPPQGEDAGGSGAPQNQVPLESGGLGTGGSEAGAEAPAPLPQADGGSGSRVDPGAQAPPVTPPMPGDEAPTLPAPPPAPFREPRREGVGVSELEDENRRLRRIVADQALEILRLKDLLDGS